MDIQTSVAFVPGLWTTRNVWKQDRKEWPTWWAPESLLFQGYFYTVIWCGQRGTRLGFTCFHPMPLTGRLPRSNGLKSHIWPNDFIAEAAIRQNQLIKEGEGTFVFQQAHVPCRCYFSRELKHRQIAKKKTQTIVKAWSTPQMFTQKPSHNPNVCLSACHFPNHSKPFAA